MTESPQPAETTNVDISMGEYSQLKQELFFISCGLTILFFTIIAIVKDLHIALNYLLGAVFGLVYLRMLAKDVDRVTGENQKFSSNRFALFVGLMIVAIKIKQLEVLPIFLGFLTYKPAIIIYAIKTVLFPSTTTVESKSVDLTNI